jgi:predicted transcriptional regulator
MFWRRQTRPAAEKQGEKSCRHIPRLYRRATLTLARRFRFVGCLEAGSRVTLKSMEVHFTPEQQAQLAQIATQAGTAPDRLVTNVVVRYLDEEARFLAAVEKGIAAADRGEFIEEEEMDVRLEAMFKA